jgi:hypothetical protein
LSVAHEGKALFWLVYPGKTESAEAIRTHDREYGYKIPSLRDPQKALVKESQAEITPEAAVFDGKGHLVYHGRIDNLYEEAGRARTVATTHELEDAIESAMSGKSVPASSTHAVGCYIPDFLFFWLLLLPRWGPAKPRALAKSHPTPPIRKRG